jgi:hypothetical protein
MDEAMHELDPHLEKLLTPVSWWIAIAGIIELFGYAFGLDAATTPPAPCLSAL